MNYLGDFPTSGKVGFLWNTNAQTGASITRSTDGTLKIFKMHATAATWATERSSLVGVTQLEDFDQTGIHSVHIDLSDNTDAGFYAAGNEYQVAITAATVDTLVVSAVLASFSIERAGGVLALIKAGTAKVDVFSISGDSTAADNLEAMFDGTGYIHASAPSSRDQISSIAGGLSVQEQVDSSTVIQGTAVGAITLMNTDDDSRYVVTDAAAGIDFILKFSPADTMSHPVEVHFHGFFNDVGAPFTNTLNIQAYNFNAAAWETVQVLSDAAADQNFDIPLAVQNQAGAAVTVNTVSCIVGDVLVRFLAAATETGNTMNVDHITVGFAGSPITAAEVADAVWDELVTGHDGAGKAGTQLWTDIDAIVVDVAGLDGAAMRGTDSAALANVCTETRLAELDAANLPTTTDNILTDTGTTLDGRIPAALVGGRMDSNASAIAGVAAAATNLAASAGVIYIGSVTGAAATTTLIDSALTQAADGFWIGRIVIFTSGTLKYQATDITAFDAATDKLTFTALTGTPGAGDTYVIV